MAAPRGGRPAGARGTLVSLLALALLATAGASGAEVGRLPGVRQEAARLLAELARVRGLSAPGPLPPIVVRTREERRRFVAGELARKLSPARIEAERRALVAWRLVPAGFDVAGFLADLVAEQAAAYYDPGPKVLTLANWLPADLREDALAHELVHVLQDRLVGLDRFLGGPPGHSDAALARRALVEGEAVALALELRLRREGRELARLPDVAAHQRAIVASPAGPVLARAPRFLRASLVFPYAEGLGFVHRFRQRHPWAALSDVYRDPPPSSAQIVHPERYLERREDPRPIVLPDLGRVLGPDARPVAEDGLGEFGLREVLDAAAIDGAPADGWAGDRYALWDRPGAPSVLVALVLATSEPAAGALADALGRWIAGHVGASDAAAPGREATWTRGAETILLERRGRRILLVDRAPPALLDGVRATLWAAVGPSGYRTPASESKTIPASTTVAPGQISRTR
jgi:hypothetical protein